MAGFNRDPDKRAQELSAPEMPHPSVLGIADMTAALQVRKLRQRRKAIKRWLLGVVAAILTGTAVWAVFFSDLLALTQLRVEGNSIISVDEVVTAAQAPMNIPLARVDVAAISERVAALPQVAEVSVGRSWPHTLRISIVERTVVCQRLEGGVYQWVSADGVVFNVTAERQDVPVVRTATIDAQLLADAATVVVKLPSVVLDFLSEVQAISRDMIVIELNDGRQILWGSADDSELKAQVIVPLLQVAATVYDVSAPGHPVIR
ncbi:MAG: FtsQ-type POTRA domain-containing protein [Propionibacteriaceae bacterium]|jgi:cell division protein FtsQ|nr:FtsQ-type POTRA domain-containing protein [Propionibacteriaceae bacterium]